MARLSRGTPASCMHLPGAFRGVAETVAYHASAHACREDSHLQSLFPASGFQEGLSLTVHDEIKRYCKYAFGCSEMIFNPLADWLRLGPISGLFRTYVGLRSIPWYTKVSPGTRMCIVVSKQQMPRPCAAGLRCCSAHASAGRSMLPAAVLSRCAGVDHGLCGHILRSGAVLALHRHKLLPQPFFQGCACS